MNEREEMAEENSKMDGKVGETRQEIIRMAQGCRSMFITAVAPNGEMVTLCFYSGYADLRAIQIEFGDRIKEVIAQNAKRVPSQLL